MSTQDDSQGNGRATVALVNSKVATVDAKIDGLAELIRAEFTQLRGLPVAVASLTERVLHTEARITQLEKEQDERQGWRRVSLPQILIGLIGLVIAVVNVVVLLNVS